MLSVCFLRNAIGCAAILGLSGLALAANTFQLEPYKDRLFKYPAVLESKDKGAFVTIDYRKERDLYDRDQIPERRVKGHYVSTKPNRQQRGMTVTLGGTSVEAFEVGQPAGARFAVVFVHGRGGDRHLGAKDWTFGGNFNRLKNLAVRNGGVYYVPTIPSFDSVGLDHLKAVISHVRHSAPDAPLILACGSMGSVLCWASGKDKK